MLTTAITAIAVSVAYQLARQLLSARWGDRRHIDCLRQLLAANGSADPWDRPCANCGRRMRDSNAYAVLAGHAREDGSRHVTAARFWHTDRPACAAAFAADEEVRASYTQGEQS
jgi:hypothetical protein